MQDSGSTYRERIRDHYEQLSRSYRRVADYVMSRYYDVSFLTAAQLAQAVNVDTTTVIRFSQRLGYNGYPDLLADLRAQVKDEIYRTYEPQALGTADPAGRFQARAEQEKRNLNQMLIHNPPDHVRAIAAMLDRAERLFLVGEGYADAAVRLTAQQLRHRNLRAEVVEQDGIQRAALLKTWVEINRTDARAAASILIIGVSAADQGRDVAQVLQFARSQGFATLGIVGSLASPVNRMSDMVLFAPTDGPGPLPSTVCLHAALGALVEMAIQDDEASAKAYVQDFQAVYQNLAEMSP